MTRLREILADALHFFFAFGLAALMFAAAAFAGAIGAAIVVVMLASVADAAEVVADPPYIVRVTATTWGYTPDGQRIALPAGTEIDACAPDPIILRTGPRVADVAACWAERPLFRDGFED